MYSRRPKKVAFQPDCNYCGFSFKAGPFFCWVAIFALLQVATPFFFFAFLVVVLLVIFTSSFSRRCSYCHSSTASNSHTVVLSKPASYSPALFSIPVKRRERAYQSFIIVYGMGKVHTLVGVVNARQKYAESKTHMVKIR